jgi:hypothetical protein
MSSLCSGWSWCFVDALLIDNDTYCWCYSKRELSRIIVLSNLKQGITSITYHTLREPSLDDLLSGWRIFSSMVRIINHLNTTILSWNLSQYIIFNLVISYMHRENWWLGICQILIDSCRKWKFLPYSSRQRYPLASLRNGWYKRSTFWRSHGLSHRT